MKLLWFIAICLVFVAVHGGNENTGTRDERPRLSNYLLPKAQKTVGKLDNFSQVSESYKNCQRTWPSVKEDRVVNNWGRTSKSNKYFLVILDIVDCLTWQKKLFFINRR